MRLTPADLGMRLLTEGAAPMVNFASRAEGIAHGRKLLVQIAGVDHGYDLKAWHDYLVAHAADYSFDAGAPYPTAVEAALADRAWRDAVAVAESQRLCEKLIQREQETRHARDSAEAEWSGRPRRCPKCSTTFTSVQDKGQCPHCRHTFLASEAEGDS